MHEVLVFSVFLAAVDVPSIFPVLHKARIDNMKDYVEKKRLRLAAEKQKEPNDAKTSTDVDTDHVVPTRPEVASDS